MEEQKKKHRLLLMPSPLQGHITPLLHLAQILFSNGFSITILHTLFNSPDPTSYPHFSFHAIPDRLSESEAATLDAVHLTDLINIRCAQPLKEYLASLLSNSPQPLPCFISDAALHFTRPVCDEFKLPRLVLRTGGASSFHIFASFPLLREKGYLPVQESRLEEPVVDFPPLKVKDLPKFQSQDPEAFYKLVCRFVEECKASSGVIWNTFEELESSALTKLRQDFPIPIYPIGPFHKRLLTGSASSASLLTPDKSCMSWLDKQEHKSVVYVSFGSIASISEGEFLEIAWGLANSQQPFLWVIRPGLIRDSEWLEALPSGFLENLGGRGYIVKWAPQEQVLSHPAVGAFWTHNGWNSTLESICEGVPMICMPCFADQKVNAKFASSVWKVGVQIENKLERGEVEKTIKKIMVGDGAKEIKENALNLKEKASACLREGGSSHCFLDSLVSHILSVASSASRPH
ncbi:UDP-glycosyltransferase 76B1-like [Vigna unguiculata]|uniref:Cytokinin-N-glucosyltransferase n=1 Tax=Vigna unguiculata TaxID=3917 RepID=A0A4D6MFH4_VIGUN|nr:UDP-glycosyltransferase 76B1-like [Vigna unguiculata]QCD98544.1 cytokinin-N-glucosyltransferase [Vigna unguiculata]